MQRFSISMPVVLTSTTVVGLLIALVGTWLLSGDARVNTIGIGAALAYLAGGVPAGRRALKALWNEHILDIDLLMIVAAIAAAVVGAVVEGAVLLTLFSLSTTMEERAMGRARRAIEALMELRPETAFRKSVEGAVEEVLAAQLDVGDIVVLRPGARVPADGTVLRGRGALDESTITGESMPVGKEPGGKVFEATVNLDGVLEVQITKSLEQSTVARMIALVTEAQAAKAPSERFSAWLVSAIRLRYWSDRSSPSAFSTGLGGTGRPRFIGPRHCWLQQARAQSSFQCLPPSCRHCQRRRAVGCFSRVARR